WRAARGRWWPTSPPCARWPSVSVCRRRRSGWCCAARWTAPPDLPDLKYYLSNAPAATPLATLVWVSGMRWPIESCFAEGKGEVGLDHYELRFWPGWHHHMTLVLLAHHFLVRLQQRLDQRGGGSRTIRTDINLILQG